MPADAHTWDPLTRAQWLESTTLLPGYILASQGDRMLMANSVEGRFPFLDRDVVEFAMALPARHKLLGLDEKHILKRAFADVVPEADSRATEAAVPSPGRVGVLRAAGPCPTGWARPSRRSAVRDAGHLRAAHGRSARRQVPCGRRECG